MIAFLAGALVGALAGAFATRDAHRATEGWGARIGRSRFRFANLPVGGTFAFAAGIIAPGLFGPLLLGASAGMTVTAVGWRYVDPLPPVPVRDRLRETLERRRDDG